MQMSFLNSAMFMVGFLWVEERGEKLCHSIHAWIEHTAAERKGHNFLTV